MFIISSNVLYLKIKYYSHYTLGGCPYGRDDVWNVTWPATNASTTAKQKCPGSSEAEGKNILLVIWYCCNNASENYVIELLWLATSDICHNRSSS